MRGRRLSVVVLACGLAASLAVGDTVRADDVGTEGCTAEFWLNATGDWEEYNPGTTLDEVFNFPESLFSFRDQTMLQALSSSPSDTTTLEGAVQRLMHDATAAFLNAASESVGYPYRRFTDPFYMERQINDALRSLSPSSIAALAATLDAANHSVCALLPGFGQSLAPAGGTAGAAGTGSNLTGAAAAAPSDDGSLPETGTNAPVMLLIALGLLAAGVTLLVVLRQRSSLMPPKR